MEIFRANLSKGKASVVCAVFPQMFIMSVHLFMRAALAVNYCNVLELVIWHWYGL